MKITLITVGKIKERFFEAAIEEYSKRLSRYCRLEILQVADEKTPDGAKEALERQIREKEGERILSHIRDGAYVIALAIEGKQLSSEELAARINRLGVEGKGQLVFHYWRFSGAFKSCYEPGRLSPELFAHDISASADAGDPAGADLSQLSDHRRGTLS